MLENICANMQIWLCSKHFQTWKHDFFLYIHSKLFFARIIFFCFIKNLERFIFPQKSVLWSHNFVSPTWFGFIKIFALLIVKKR